MQLILHWFLSMGLMMMCVTPAGRPADSAGPAGGTQEFEGGRGCEQGSTSAVPP